MPSAIATRSAHRRSYAALDGRSAHRRSDSRKTLIRAFLAVWGRSRQSDCYQAVSRRLVRCGAISGHACRRALPHWETIVAGSWCDCRYAIWDSEQGANLRLDRADACRIEDFKILKSNELDQVAAGKS